MENPNYQADFQSWMRTGKLTVTGDNKIWLRWLFLGEKVTPKTVYDEMIRSGIKWPSEFKLKGKKIIFEKLAGAQPLLIIKGKKVFADKGSKKTTISGVDIGQMKNVMGIVKSAAAGEDISGKTIVSNADEYYQLLCEGFFQLMYDRISDRDIKRIRNA